MQLQTVLTIALAIIVLMVMGIIIFLPTQTPVVIPTLPTPVAAEPTMVPTAVPPPSPAALLPVNAETQPLAPTDIEPMGKTVTAPHETTQNVSTGQP